MHTHKKLYVISDLHIGGEYGDPKNASDRGFRMCRAVPVLEKFVCMLHRRHTQDGIPVELVINGDFVDFLAEKWDDAGPWHPFIQDGQAAASRLALVIRRDQPFFRALAKFIAHGHSVTILLGNHDVELSLPLVRATLFSEFGADERSVRFIYDGEAYVTGNVLIEHGNRYDGFNVVNYDRLRRMRASQSRGEEIKPDTMFDPPLGSLLVSAVMNRIKPRYPFIDLLKPETEAALPILLALAPEYRTHVLYLASLYARSFLHRPNAAGRPRLSGEINGARAGEALLESVLLERQIAPAAVERYLDDTVPEEDRAGATQHRGEIAGGRNTPSWGYLQLLVAGKSKPLSQRISSLMTALQASRHDYSFNMDSELPTYLEPARKLLKRGFDVVVFGHTHLAKEIHMEEGTYVNTGTWCDLIRFPFELLDLPPQEAQQALENFVRTLEHGDVQDYIEFRPTFAEIEIFGDGRKPAAQLKTFSPDQE